MKFTLQVTVDKNEEETDCDAQVIKSLCEGRESYHLGKQNGIRQNSLQVITKHLHFIKFVYKDFVLFVFKN